MASLTEIYRYMQGLADRYRFEILVVDDGSTDETYAIAEAFAATRPEVRVLRHVVNFRLGQALRYGFARSKGDYVVAFDSDLSYAPEHIGRMLETLETEHARVVIASPYMKGGRTSAIPWGRKAMSAGVNRLLAAASQGDLATVTGMVRAYDGPFVRSLNLKAMGPEINTEILYKAQIMRARVIEIPAHLDWSNQTERMKTRRVSLKVSTTSKLLMFASFLFRPMIFFFVPGLLLLLVSAWTLASVALGVARHFKEGVGSFDAHLTHAFAQTYQERPHSFIIGGLAFVVAVQLITLGLLATQTKRYFEELFHMGTNNRRAIDEVAARIDRMRSAADDR
jgi:glycosyltransferase involved in cell wall biosynthesis